MAHKVLIAPNGESIEVNEETSLLQALRDAKKYVRSSCGGHASCSDCIIKIKEGADNINTPTFEEVQLLGNVFHITKERLACQTKVTGDIEIDLSSHDEASDQTRLKQKSKSFMKGRKKAPDTPKAPAVKVRKKEEYDEILAERKLKKEEKTLMRDERDAKWEKHWERTEEDPTGPGRPKKLGGGKRPQAFKTPDKDEEEAHYASLKSARDSNAPKDTDSERADFRKNRRPKSDK